MDAMDFSFSLSAFGDSSSGRSASHAQRSNGGSGGETLGGDGQLTSPRAQDRARVRESDLTRANSHFHLGRSSFVSQGSVDDMDADIEPPFLFGQGAETGALAKEELAGSRPKGGGGGGRGGRHSRRKNHSFHDQRSTDTKHSQQQPPLTRRNTSASLYATSSSVGVGGGGGCSGNGGGRTPRLNRSLYKPPLNSELLRSKIEERERRARDRDKAKVAASTGKGKHKVGFVAIAGELACTYRIISYRWD